MFKLNSKYKIDNSEKIYKPHSVVNFIGVVSGEWPVEVVQIDRYNQAMEIKTSTGRTILPQDVGLPANEDYAVLADFETFYFEEVL